MGTTAIPGTCSVPVLGPTSDTSDCSGIFPPGACDVRCATGFVGTASSFTCTSSDDGFVGVAPVCTSTTTTTSLTATTTTTTTTTTMTGTLTTVTGTSTLTTTSVTTTTPTTTPTTTTPTTTTA